MKKGVSIFIFIFIFVFFSVPNGISYAQIQSNDIDLIVTPPYPSPNQSVTAKLNSFVTSLDKSYIIWSINNEQLSSGIGKHTFSFTTGELGSKITLTATIETISGQTITKTLNIDTTSVDILYEAVDSYTPPFYKGKALVSREGSFKVVAIPNIITNGEKLNPNNLSYTWKKDGKGQPNSSGWGKNSFTFKNTYLDLTNKIEVTITDIYGNTNTKGLATLSTVTPEINFYEKDVNLGMRLQKTINSSFNVAKNGSIIIASPYFFEGKNLNSPDFKISWFINGTPANIPPIKNELLVKGEEGASGNALIKFIINNPKKLFQSTEKQINVAF